MPLVTRISSLGLQQGTLGNIGRLQSELGTTQQQISTGKNASTFKELSARGQTERVLGFENQKKKTADFIRNNTIVSNRVQTYNSSLTNIITVAEQLRNLLVQRRTPTSANSLPLTQLTDSYLSTIKSSLNIEVEGRYLFSGGKTDTRPVDDIESPNYTIDPVTSERLFNSKYYEGDNLKLRTQASDTLSLEYGVTANDPAFQQLIGAIHLAVEGDASNNDDTLAEAVDLVSKTITDLSSVQANINNNIAILDQTNAAHTDFNIFLDQSLNEITETDIGSATIRLSSLETTLQASFLAYSRISSLKLSDFLR